jgi:3-hydroxyacyl-CoA dehydrogenase
MFYADTVGADKVVQALRVHEKRLGPDFKLAPLLVKTAEEGKRFTG